MSGLIWIQIILHSDDIPERNFRKKKMDFEKTNNSRRQKSTNNFPGGQRVKLDNSLSLHREHSCSVVECSTRDQRAEGFEPHRCHCVVSLSKNINPSFVLVQPRKTHPFITERLLMGRKELNQPKKLFLHTYFTELSCIPW